MTVDVAGAAIFCSRFEATGVTARDPVLLVHGGSANSAWWGDVVDLLVPTGPVGVMDLSGHGRSSWRGAYDVDTWVAEIAAVAAALFPGGCALAGHSLGGSLVNAAIDRVSPSAAILIDALGRPPSGHGQATAAPQRIYASRADAEAAVVARKPTWSAHAARRIARASVERIDVGWRMRRDPQVAGVGAPDSMPELGFAPVTLIVGGASSFRENIDNALSALANEDAARVSVERVDRAGHDVMIDAPRRVATIIDATVRRARTTRESSSTAPRDTFDGRP